MEGVIYGAFSAGFSVAAAFFLRFWRRTRQGLMAVFSMSFALLSVSYLLLGLTGVSREEQSWFYLIRLIAFVLILGAISWTNLKGRQQ